MEAAVHLVTKCTHNLDTRVCAHTQTHTHTHKRAIPADGGELGLLLHLLGEDLELLLERLLVVVGVHVVIVRHHRGQELGAGEAEELLKHSQISKGGHKANQTCIIYTSQQHNI